MRLLALDPGETVGWASLFLPNSQGGYTAGQVPRFSLRDHLSFAHSQDPIRVLIFESFELDESHPNLVPVECIGVVKDWAHANRIHLWPQQAQQAKHFFTDDRLRQFHLYRVGLKHANDAMRHLLYYLHFHMMEPMRELTR